MLQSLDDQVAKLASQSKAFQAKLDAARKQSRKEKRRLQQQLDSGKRKKGALQDTLNKTKDEHKTASKVRLFLQTKASRTDLEKLCCVFRGTAHDSIAHAMSLLYDSCLIGRTAEAALSMLMSSFTACNDVHPHERCNAAVKCFFGSPQHRSLAQQGSFRPLRFCRQSGFIAAVRNFSTGGTVSSPSEHESPARCRYRGAITAFQTCLHSTYLHVAFRQQG